MEVKVIRVPGRTSTVEIPEGACVADALTQAGMSVGAGESCKLNAITASMEAVLTEGDKIIIAKGAKGNNYHTSACLVRHFLK